jgi:hypothetical protein
VVEQLDGGPGRFVDSGGDHLMTTE